MSENRRFARFADGKGSALDQIEPVENSLQQADLDIFGGEEPQRRLRVPENALVKREDGAFVYKQFVMTATGIVIPPDVKQDEWEDVGYVLRNLESSVSWMVGDWAAFAYDTWDISYEEIAKHYGYVTQTIETYVSICRSVPGLIRNQTVPFSHHRLVAKLPDEEQDYWLKQAAASRWTLDEMRAAMAKRSTVVPPRRLLTDEIKADWTYVRSLEDRQRTPKEKNDTQIKIDRIRKALDEVERQLWEK